MSQIIIDEHLGRMQVLEPIRQWITAKRVQDLRAGEILKDDRLLNVMTGLDKPTLVTIDGGLWKHRYADRRYCILFFALLDTQQYQIPSLLRKVFRLKLFKTKAARMGKVARITPSHISYWQVGSHNLQVVALPPDSKIRKR